MPGKLRFCECGRELEKYCYLCSECRQINIDHATDVRNASKAHRERVKKYYHEVFKHKYPGFKKIREASEREWKLKNTHQ